MDVSLSGSLSLFVGANGSGKTNLFRVVRYLVDWLLYGGLPDSDERFDSTLLGNWVRNRNQPAFLEVGVAWDQADERELLAAFVRAAFANTDAIARAVGLQSGTWQHNQAWNLFLSHLTHLLPTSEMNWLFEGTLGLRYLESEDVALFFRPSGATSWLLLMAPYAGFAAELPGRPIVNAIGLSTMASYWVKDPSSVKAEDLKTFFELEGRPESGLPPMRLSWPAVIQAFLQDALRVAPGLSLMELKLEPINNEWSLSHFSPLLLKPLGIRRWDNHIIDLRRVLAHLLRQRVTSTDDLLTPPEAIYPSASWGKFAAPLTSAHLGAHLLAMRIGDDDERVRYSSIQNTFSRLTTRMLDVSASIPTSEDSNQTITLLQRGPGDPRSTPLTASGSGLLEVAYFSAALHSPRSHVLLLDEPGRSLHPQSLIRLRHFLGNRSALPSAQTLLITHSPYLVDASDLANVYRVWRDSNGYSRVSKLGLVTNKERKPARREMQRQDRWGRSPNWPALLFSAAVVVVDGETELGSLPEWYAQRFGEPMEALGLSILCVNGKGGNSAAFQDLDAFHIPWVALVDGDSLAPRGGNVWHALAEAGRLTTKQANAAQRHSFEWQVQRLEQEFLIYVVGGSVDECFEHVVHREIPKSTNVPRGLGGSKVLKGRWLAQTFGCPSFLESPFDELRRVAQSQLGLHEASR